MTTLGIVLIVFGWWLLGLLGLIYDWSGVEALDVGDCVFCAFIGLFVGPFAWLVAWPWPIVVIPRRKKPPASG